MARSKSVLPALGRTSTPFASSQEVPWQTVEKKIGISFSKKHREEIYLCGFIAVMHGNVARDAVTTNEVEKLRQKIIKHAEGLIEIIRTARSEGGKLLSEDREKQLQALNQAISDRNFDIVNMLEKLVPVAENIARELHRTNVLEESHTLSPEVIELAHFISECVNSSQKRPAKTNGPGFRQEAFEHHRWGVLLSPRHGPLPLLASTLLQREISAGQIEHAFRTAREMHLLQ